MTTKCKFRHYKSIRNYAEYRMIRAPHDLTWNDIDNVTYEMQYITEKRFTCNEKFFFFEDETDALLFRLRYGK